MTTFTVTTVLSRDLNSDMTRPLCREVLDDILCEQTEIIVDTLHAVMSLEGMSPSDYEGETLTITIRIKPEETEEESQEAEE